MIHIIHDTRMFDRYEPLLLEMQRQMVDFRVWDIVEDRNSVVSSINKSHKNIVRWAKEKGLEEICIGEDDLYFPSEKGWEWFLKNKPTEYDLYLAATYIPPITNNLICGFHLYFIHSRFYDTFLNTPEDVHIDTYMEKLNGKYVFCYPMAALQRSCWSANNKSVVNYNAILKKEDIYGF
jgi:hypothetical protein